MLNWITKHPSTSHVLTAMLGFCIVFPFCKFVLGDLSPAVYCAVVISAFYYGREAGQREHDLKHTGVGEISAWIGADTMYLWAWSNRRQWLAPTISLIILSVIAAVFFS